MGRCGGIKPDEEVRRWGVEESTPDGEMGSLGEHENLIEIFE